MKKDGKPAIIFTPSELQPGIQRLQHSLIAKLSAGHPPIEVVQKVLADAWNIEDSLTIRAMDARHILILISSRKESNRILAHPFRKVGQSLFRLFLWTPEFHRWKEPTTTISWIKLPGLLNQLYDEGYLKSIVSTFSRFIAIDERTRVCSNPSFARVCIEVDLTMPIPGEVWVGLGTEHGFWQPITYEAKLQYCSRCHLHGHVLANCRKGKPPTAESPKPVTGLGEWIRVTKKRNRRDAHPEILELHEKTANHPEDPAQRVSVTEDIQLDDSRNIPTDAPNLSLEDLSQDNLSPVNITEPQQTHVTTPVHGNMHADVKQYADDTHADVAAKVDDQLDPAAHLALIVVDQVDRDSVISPTHANTQSHVPTR
ncbi:hypothetical protein QQ045_011742 [Rhodiola kirilowii]